MDMTQGVINLHLTDILHCIFRVIDEGLYHRGAQRVRSHMK